MGWLLAVLSGVLAGFSYPTVFGGFQLPEMGFLAFFAWVPLFQALAGVSPRRAFLLSGLAAVFHYSISMYWVYTALHTFGHLSPMVSVLVLGVLIVVLAAHFALIFLFSQWAALRLNLPVHWLRPFFWVAFEYQRGHVPMGGHPWSQIAYSQGGFLTFIQLSDLVGVYGVTFLLVSINEALSQLVSRWRRRVPGISWRFVGGVAVLFLAALIYGRDRLTSAAVVPDSTLKVGAVQGNIAQDEKWNPHLVRMIQEKYLQGTLALQARGAQLILWPEASVPRSLFFDDDSYNPDFEGVTTDLLFGVITRSRKEPARPRRPIYNSALLVDPEGRTLDYYHKRHLVPFGEYVPWKDFLFFAKKLTVEAGDLAPGDRFRPMLYRDRRLGVLICYEDLFPEISRVMVGQGAGTLVNLTNDAWYGRSSAAYQHQVFSQFRSVETRRALIRATNTGLSSLIDRWGRVLWQGNLFEYQEFLTDLPFYHDRSIYVRIGDAFPIVCLALSGVVVLASIFKRNRKTPCPKN